LRPVTNVKCKLLQPDQGSWPTPPGTPTVKEEPRCSDPKGENERTETDVSCESTELQQKEVTQEGSPQGWPVATGTLYIPFKKTVRASVPFQSCPSVVGEGERELVVTGECPEWAVDPWVVSIT